MNQLDVDKRFPGIIDFLAGIYNQDVWTEFATHGQIWDDYIHYGNKATVERFLAEVQEIGAMSSEEIEGIAPYLKSHGMMIDQNCLLPFLSEVVCYIEAHRDEVGIGYVGS